MTDPNDRYVVFYKIIYKHDSEIYCKPAEDIDEAFEIVNQWKEDNPGFRCEVKIMPFHRNN